MIEKYCLSLYGVSSSEKFQLKLSFMLQPIDNLPDNILGLKAVGIISKNDYTDILIPAAENIFSKYDRIRMIYYLGPEFQEFEYSAMWEDVKLGLKHYNGWEKIAIVTDWRSLGWFARVTGLFIPGSIESFSVQYYDKAFRWIKE